MRLLLDTHALLWALADSRSLSRRAHTLIIDSENEILVSAVSAWEISIKRALGRLTAPRDLRDAVAEAGFRERPITIADTEALELLPSHHKDPFDRMLVAQASVDGIPIISRDAEVAQYPIQTVW